MPCQLDLPRARPPLWTRLCPREVRLPGLRVHYGYTICGGYGTTIALTVVHNLYFVDWRQKGTEMKLTQTAIGGDTALAVGTAGHGPLPILMLHGYSLSQEGWDRVVPLFPADQLTLYAYDLRGFGASSGAQGPYRQAQHAQDVIALMDRLELEKACLVGHSLGGAISQEVTVTWPDRVFALVSCNAFARFNALPGLDEEKSNRARRVSDPTVNREVVSVSATRYLEPRNTTPADIETLTRIALSASTDALHDQLIDAYTAPALPRAAYEALRVPTLSLTGATDTVVPLAQTIDLAEAVPEAELSVMPRNGHTPMWEDPVNFARIVTEFLLRRTG